jgi:CRP/FNR family transcriptional regulator, anaerobic regulatory protein
MHTILAGSGLPETSAIRPKSASGAWTAPPAIADFERTGQIVDYPRGKTVIEEGKPALQVFKVVSGALRSVRLLADGRRHITQFLLPGDFFGFTHVSEYLYSVEAAADTTVVRYSRRAFEAFLDEHPKAGRSFLNVLSKELAAAQDHLLLLGRKNAEERLANFLLNLADTTASSAEVEPTATELPMNRSDIADYLGLTIETVSRLLTRFRQRKVIDLPTSHSVIFRDREALEALSVASGEE